MSPSKGFTGFGDFIPEDGRRVGFRNVMLFLFIYLFFIFFNLEDGRSPKEENVSHTPSSKAYGVELRCRGSMCIKFSRED